MDFFNYKNGELYCEDVPAEKIAREVGTACYVYSKATFLHHYRQIAEAFKPLNATVCYSVKSCGNINILKMLAAEGCGFDVTSGGELFRAMQAGGDPKKMIYAGVGKTDREIADGITAGIAAFNIESEAEIENIDRIAGEMGKSVVAALRINPDVDAKTHAKITTGKSENKFGIPLKYAAEAYAAAAKYPHLEVKGVQMHIGSQLTSAEPFIEAVKKVVPFAAQLKQDYGITYFSIGGGIGIIYQDALASGEAAWWSAQAEGERPLTPEAYGAALTPLLAPLGLKILLEPGRFLVGNAGVLLSRVEYLKRGAGRNFLVLDAAMNDLVRPAMYEAYHEVVPLLRDTSRPALQADLVGPICESGDCFAKDRTLQTVGEGELMAFMSAGAYGYTMASRYNTRPMAAEVLVCGSRFELVNARENFDAMVAGENIPGFLTT